MADIHEVMLAQREAGAAIGEADALAQLIRERDRAAVGENGVALAFLVGAIAIAKGIEAAAVRLDWCAAKYGCRHE